MNTNIEKGVVIISTRSLGSLLWLVSLLAFSWFQWFVFLGPGFREINALEVEMATIETMGLMWVPTIAYLLLCTAVALTVNIFRPLKRFGDKGLVWWFIVGGFVCSLVGLMGGIIAGLSAMASGPGDGYASIIFGALVGLTGGLLLGFAATPATGLPLEFKLK